MRFGDNLICFASSIGRKSILLLSDESAPVLFFALSEKLLFVRACGKRLQKVLSVTKAVHKIGSCNRSVAFFDQLDGLNHK